MQRALLAALVFTVFLATPSAQLLPPPPGWLNKLEPALQERLASLSGTSRIVVRAVNGGALAPVASLVAQLGGTLPRALPIVEAHAAQVPNTALAILATSPLVAHISMDRVVAGAMERTGASVGAVAARQEYGYDGHGIGVAVVDSGVAPAHDDLRDGSGPQRVRAFVDFVGGQQAAYDDYGHGTHVAGIVAGNGFDSDGRRTGIAPGADLVALKVLDASGSGRISDVIAALGWVVVNRALHNIRVVNLSIAAGVYESYYVDPLTLAARVAVDSGIVVVAAAGNHGRTLGGVAQYGGITAPGNAPWVLTVGASSHMGTVDRADDTMAIFSSRGPTAIDRAAKPDLVAPGVGIESLSDPASAFYTSRAPYLLPGTSSIGYLPYLSLSGTSMAAPVVAGTVVLMLQANPSLTPNQVKALLQHTADAHPGYDTLTAGAGFLNAKLAVDLSRFYYGAPVSLYPPTVGWGRAIARWNGQSIGWTINPAGDGDTVVWGTEGGDTVVWGTDDGDTVVWGTSCTDPGCQPVVWNQP